MLLISFLPWKLDSCFIVEIVQQPTKARCTWGASSCKRWRWGYDNGHGEYRYYGAIMSDVSNPAGVRCGSLREEEPKFFGDR